MSNLQLASIDGPGSKKQSLRTKTRLLALVPGAIDDDLQSTIFCLAVFIVRLGIKNRSLL